jgi:hypothetical protein
MLNSLTSAPHGAGLAADMRAVAIHPPEFHNKSIIRVWNYPAFRRGLMQMVPIAAGMSAIGPHPTEKD